MTQAIASKPLGRFEFTVKQVLCPMTASFANIYLKLLMSGGTEDNGLTGRAWHFNIISYEISAGHGIDCIRFNVLRPYTRANSLEESEPI